MSKRSIPKHQKSALTQTLIAAFAALSATSALATTNNLISPDASNNASWSLGESYEDAANIINMDGIWKATDINDNLELGYGLYIGYEKTGTLDITVTPSAGYSSMQINIDDVDPSMPPLKPNWDPSLRVGDAGGNGTLVIELQELPEEDIEEFRMDISEVGLGVGLGEGSTGLVNILGTGKISGPYFLEAPNLVYFGDSRQNFLIGQAGGNGTLNLEGANLSIYLGQNNEEDEPLNYISVGEGLGSNGSVNVQGSAQIAIGNPLENGVSERADEFPLSFIGKDGGDGVISIKPSTSEIQNQANFVLGLAVGHNNGNGTLEVLQGGKSFISNGGNNDLYEEGHCQASHPGEYPAIAPPPLLISADGKSTGLVSAIGSGSELLVAGKSNDQADPDDIFYIKKESIGEIQMGAGSTLVASDSGTIKVGVSRLIVNEEDNYEKYSRSTVGGLGPITVSGAGKVVYGSKTSTASLAGTIQASQINIQDTTSQLNFNHTGELNFNLPLAGNGLLVQQAGSTTISATLAGLPEFPDGLFAFDSEPTCAPAIANQYPANQSAFTGGLDVQGGTLILPESGVLPGLTSTQISGGTLVMSATDQDLGAVNITGGFLNLSGIPSPTTKAANTATDTATASNWTGAAEATLNKGTVLLDTVLGTDSSASDKLNITGAITGTTHLQINNLGGTGAETTGLGILLVEADSPNPDKSFALAAPVIAGGFQYTLKQTNNNWYLVSTPYVAPPQSATPVPSLSLLGLLGLGGLLATFSGRSLRSKKRSKASST